MKKIIAFALTLAMALTMSVTTFAADPTDINQDSGDKTGSTNVKFSVDPTYSITIPAEVTLAYDGDSNTYKNSGEISTGTIRLGFGLSITVAVESDFTMTSAENAELEYTMTIGDSEEAVETGAIVATFGTSTDEQRVILKYSAPNPKYAGNYNDTLIFTITAPAIGQ